MNKLDNKEGISLIVLVITIIVMIILATTIILSIKDSGIIDKAKEAKAKTEIATAKELSEIARAEWEMLSIREQKDRDISDYVKEKLENAGINPDDYAIDDNGKVDLPVAMVGEIKYATLQEAVNVAKDGTRTTITIINSINLDEMVEIDLEKDIILDLNGYSINSVGNAIYSIGTLKIIDGSKDKTGSIRATSDKAKYDEKYDLNNDGVISDDDINIVTQYIGTAIDESTSEEIKKCDFSGDNVVQAEDVNIVSSKKNEAYALYLRYGTVTIEGISQDKISGEPRGIHEEEPYVTVEWK